MTESDKRPPLEYVHFIFFLMLWPNDRLLGGFNPDSWGISTKQPMSMVQKKGNHRPAGTEAILTYQICMPFTANMWNSPPGPCWRALVKRGTNYSEIKVLAANWFKMLGCWCLIILQEKSLGPMSSSHDSFILSSWIDMAVLCNGVCTDLNTDVSVDAPLILGQSCVLFEMSVWSWTAPK